ncbi:GNAT family protein [Actinomadura sp. NPDC049382]|uniref:GNAT family N-acetyltransferase n=1 Tax=Actinomadura sp. NPDC049382 TaxID=3158220 RepID=UPI0034394A23
MNNDITGVFHRPPPPAALLGGRSHRRYGHGDAAAARLTRPRLLRRPPRDPDPPAVLPHRDIGGHLAPDYRGRGLGAELFTAGLALAHRHLGYREVRAGAEPENIASVRSL